MDFVTILLMLTAFILTRSTNLRTAVMVLLAQSTIVAFASIVSGIETGEVHYYAAAVCTVLIKAVIIPYLLFHIVGRLKREREVDTLLRPNTSSLAAAFTIALVYGLVDRTLPPGISRDVLAPAISLVLIGLQLIVIRKQAVLQIVGLNTMENGLYLLGLSVTNGLPLIIELGIFLDVLVAVIVLVILTFRLKLSYLSTDTTLLQKLKG